MSSTILLVVNVDYFFLSHRLPLALTAKNLGFRVIVCCGDTGKTSLIRNHGFEVATLPASRNFKNPLFDLHILFRLIYFYKKFRPDLIHHVTLKIVFLGSIAALITRQSRTLNAVTGLGFLFTNNRNSFIKRFIIRVLRLILTGKSHILLFQNEDDLKVFSDCRIGRAKNYRIVRGSGVDIDHFAFSPLVDKKSKPLQVVITARMVKDKGIFEFIQVAKSLKSLYQGRLNFKIYGDFDRENPSHISPDQIKSFLDSGYLEWYGPCLDAFSALVDCDIFLFPSYREGLPKSLLEACAVGRPVVCFDVPGCRDVILDGINGYVVPFGNITMLVNRVISLIEHEEIRIKMGIEGRKLIESEFCQDVILEKMMNLYHNLLGTDTLKK